MTKALKTHRKALTYLLIFSFLGWLNAAAFPVFSQDQNPDAAALKLIETSVGLYQQGSFEDALGKLSEADLLVQSREFKALANLEMAYVKFLQGRQPMIFRYHIELALKLHPELAIQEGKYRPGFLDVFRAVKLDLLKAEKPEAIKPVVEKAESAKPKVKKKHFPWLGVIMSLAIVGWLVYYLVILKTTLQVDSTPAGAKVYLDGDDTQKVTPCELKPALGAHKIRFSLNGYADVEREIVIKNGKNSFALTLDIGTYSMFTPAGRSKVQREAPCLISWDSSALAAAAAVPAAKRTMGVTSVDLELYQGESKVSDIARGVPNSGSYTWNVPGTTAEGFDFKIRLSCSGIPESSTFGPAFDLLGFREDLADNAANFWLPDTADSWKVAGGYYTASKTSEKSGVSIYNFLYSGSSYTVESKMRWSEFSGSNSAAPLFIMLGISNSFTGNAGYVLGYSMDGTIGITLVENYNFINPPTDPPPSPPTLLYSGSSSAVNTGINNWNTVKVVRNGTTYTLYINDILITTFTDSRYNPTYVMLGFGSAGVKTTCDFDYVYMTVTP